MAPEPIPAQIERPTPSEATEQPAGRSEQVASIISEFRNLYEHVLSGGHADLSRTPSEVLFEGPVHCTVHEYDLPTQPLNDALPVLLVPPMGAPATCMDLRRDHSLAGYLVGLGRPTFLLDYGKMSTRSDQDLGLEYWIDEVIPKAVKEVSQANDGKPVQIVGWCLGGILSYFTQAAHPKLPIASIASVASPFDFSQVPALEPIRLLAQATGGHMASSIVRLFGGVPGQVGKLGFMLIDPVRLATKPLFQYQSRGNPEVLSQIEAVDAMMDEMQAFPGRSALQMYHTIILSNHLNEGRIRLTDGHYETLADVSVPVMNISGTSDNLLAPAASVARLAELVPNSPSVRLESAPGGHLGVLVGLSARETTWKYLDEFLTATGPDPDRDESAVDRPTDKAAIDQSSTSTKRSVSQS